MTTPIDTRSHIEIAPHELANITGAVIVGDAGGRVRVTGCVEESSTFTGIVTVETEVGTLYLEQDLPVTIVNPALPDDGIDDVAHAVGFLRAS